MPTIKSWWVLKKYSYTILFISWVVLITLLSLFSFSGFDNNVGITIPHADKITHFIFYTTFVVLGFFALGERAKNTIEPLKKLRQIIIAAIIYGVLIEVMQHIMPFDRAAEFFDVLANCSGAFFGGLLIKKYLSLTKKLK